MKTNFLIASVVLGALSAGCSFAARSPQMYAEDTAALLETRSPAIKQCYDGVLKGDKAAAGSVTVQFTVQEESGAIVDPQVDPARTTAPEAVSQCVVQNLEGLVLDPPDQRKGEATFVWEMSATPAQTPTS